MDKINFEVFLTANIFSALFLKRLLKHSLCFYWCVADEVAALWKIHTDLVFGRKKILVANHIKKSKCSFLLSTTYCLYSLTSSCFTNIEKNILVLLSSVELHLYCKYIAYEIGLIHSTSHEAYLIVRLTLQKYSLVSLRSRIFNFVMSRLRVVP